MLAASPVRIKQLLAKLISKQIELIANHGDKERIVEIGATCTRSWISCFNKAYPSLLGILL